LKKIRRKTYNLGIDLDRLDVKVHSEEDSNHGNEVRKEERRNRVCDRVHTSILFMKLSA
jgi:hypothetical protein